MISILAQAQGGAGLSSLLILALPLVLMYFLMRSQKRKVQQQQALQRSAEVGDEIVTTSGIFGTIVSEDEEEDTVIVEIAPGTTMKMMRAGISRTLTEHDEDAYAYDDDDDDVPDDDENAQGPIRS